MNVEAYLRRINYTGSIEPTAQTLRDLQVAHLKTVPFENLSIHAGEPIVLEGEALYKKIVEQRRGGFCYECNGSFAGLLRALGFQVEMLAAGVANRQGGFGPLFDHMALAVTLDERWLVDVGFGDSFLKPLLLDSREVQVQGTQSFRIDEDGDYLILLRRNEGRTGSRSTVLHANHSASLTTKRCVAFTKRLPSRTSRKTSSAPASPKMDASQ